MSAKRAIAVLLVSVPLAGCAYLERVAIGGSGEASLAASNYASLSGDGAAVAFSALGGDLVPGDDNGVSDVYVRDLAAQTLQRASVGPGAADTDGASYLPQLDADGHVVAFTSDADDLGPTDGNDASDAYARDLTQPAVELVSVNLHGGAGNGAAEANDVSSTGRFVAFEASASNLVPDDTNQTRDAFVRDRVDTRTTRVSVGTDGTEADGPSSHAAISADGRLVAFSSLAANLVVGDTNGVADVFLHDLATGTTERVSTTPSGAELDGPSIMPTISDDGSRVAFASFATNAVADDSNGVSDIYVRDLAANTITRASVRTDGSQGTGPGDEPRLSGDGRSVVFQTSSNLAPGDLNLVTDVYVRRIDARRTIVVSTNKGGLTATYAAGHGSLSDEGFYVAFTARAPLEPADTNQVPEPYVRSVVVPTVTSASPGLLAPGATAAVELTGDGFLPGALVATSGGIRVLSTSVVTEQRMLVTVAVAPDAPSGPRNVYVILPGLGGHGILAGSVGGCAGCLAVTP